VQKKATVVGRPDLELPPAIESITVAPVKGALGITYRFGRRLALAPQGVLFAWQVFLFRRRHDAVRGSAGLTLTLQDRGQGWEPSGWTIEVSSATDSRQVDGNVATDAARDELSVEYPQGFGNLRPPFYWYATQMVVRSYLPRSSPPVRDWAVNGTESLDCPAAMADDGGVPTPGLLLEASGSPTG
jgi:hypothetical protein